MALTAVPMLSYRAGHEYDRLCLNDPPEAGDRAAHRVTAAGRRNGFTPAPVAPREAACARADLAPAKDAKAVSQTFGFGCSANGFQRT